MKPLIMNTYRVSVSPCRLKNGQWSKRRVIWASFIISGDAYTYAENLRKANPAWIIDILEPGRPLIARGDSQ